MRLCECCISTPHAIKHTLKAIKLQNNKTKSEKKFIPSERKAFQKDQFYRKIKKYIKKSEKKQKKKLIKISTKKTKERL